jgi:hypothetical protein
MTIPYSPTETTEHVEKLLQKMNAEFEPEQINVHVEPFAQIQNCFVNVDEKIKRDGGKVVYGRAIFCTDIICEAEMHAVWESPDGELMDITPREFPFSQIMFVYDENFIYSDQLTDNVRINITDNSLVDDFILLCETLEKFYTYGTRINDNELIVPEPARTLIHQYENLKIIFKVFLGSAGRPDSVCGLCESGKKYKNCCGKAIKAHFQGDLLKVKKALSK